MTESAPVENVLLYLFAAGYYVMGLGVPLAMVIAQLGFAWPVLWGRGAVTPTRRTAAGALALLCLLSGLMALPIALSGSRLMLILAVALTVPAAITLVRLHQSSRPAAGGSRER